VIIPWAIFLPRKTKSYKRVPLSVNWYRNAQYFESNAAKKLLGEIVKDQLEGVVLKTPVNVTYQVYKPTRRRSDKMNQASVGSKFLFDTMTTMGVWPDDDDSHLYNETILRAKIDKETDIKDLINMPDPLTVGKGIGRIEVCFETCKQIKE